MAKPARRPPRAVTRRSMTLVEIIIVVFLFSMLIGTAVELYSTGARSEQKLGVKLDLLHHAQIASLRIARELRQAVEIFHPPVGLTQTRPFVIFSNETNQLMVLYVNDKRELVLQNRNDSDRVEVLAQGIERLRVFRKGRRLLNYHLSLKEKTTQESFNLVSGICIRNNFN